MHSPSDSSPKAAGRERRRFPRVDVRINMAGQLSSSRVRLVNVSQGGCLVHASHMLEPGEQHVLRFTREPGGAPLTVHTRVVYVAPLSGEQDVACVAGLEFTDDSAAEKAAIQALVVVAERSAP